MNHSDKIDQIAGELAKTSGVKNIAKIATNGGVTLPTDDLSKYFVKADQWKSNAKFTTIGYDDSGKISRAATTNRAADAIILNFQSDQTLESVRDIVVKDTGGIDNNSVSVVDQGYLTTQNSVSPALDELTELAYIAIAITIFVSALNIFISTVGGILERKTSFYKLWLCGLGVKRLRLSLLIESVMPLVLFSVVASVLGYIASKNTIAVISPLNLSTTIPAVYYAIVVGLVGVAILGIWLISRQLKHMVDVNNNQTE